MDESNSFAVIDAAVDAGINLFDTAELTAHRLAETAIGGVSSIASRCSSWCFPARESTGALLTLLIAEICSNCMPTDKRDENRAG